MSYITKRRLGRREERGVPKRSELEPSTGLAERNGYAAESQPTDGLTLELFIISARYTSRWYSLLKTDPTYG